MLAIQPMLVKHVQLLPYVHPQETEIYCPKCPLGFEQRHSTQAYPKH